MGWRGEPSQNDSRRFSRVPRRRRGVRRLRNGRPSGPRRWWDADRCDRLERLVASRRACPRCHGGRPRGFERRGHRRSDASPLRPRRTRPEPHLHCTGTANDPHDDVRTAQEDVHGNFARHSDGAHPNPRRSLALLRGPARGCDRLVRILESHVDDRGRASAWSRESRIRSSPKTDSSTCPTPWARASPTCNR
jgi:hypothetical protein